MIRRIVYVLLLGLSVSMASSSWAASSGGGWSMGVGLGIVNASQDDMDAIMKASATGASSMGNGLEAVGSLAYDFGSMSLIFRPGYYWVSEEGASSEYSLNALSFFPTLRFELLSNNTITFYGQLGMGVVMFNGEVKEGSFDVEFSGNQLGYSAGLGSEFCFWPDHCFFLEANLRIASADRLTVDSSSGSPSGSSIITQYGKGQEFEINGHDYSASLSGIQGVVGYNLHF